MMSITLLTQQALFDRACAHLFAQGNTALMKGGGGAYRGCRGGGCPVGALIHPRDYIGAMEGVPVRYVSAPPGAYPDYMERGVRALRAALRRAGVNVDDAETVKLLSCLQNVHDVFGVWEWHERLASIAAQFGLDRRAIPARAA